jgi:hypothetical protein
MIDLNHEQLLPLTVLSREITNRDGRRGINVATIWRWCMKTNRYGVKLESVILGGTRMSSREALSRYVQATTAAANGESIPIRSANQRQRAIDDASRELAAAGI